MKIRKNRVAREEGQSIVILAMAMVGLLAFAGLAVDSGVIYAGSVRLARAVDAAALAGVVELPYESSLTSTARADVRAQQFLAANEIWPTAEITGTAFFASSRQGGAFGTVRYLVTATHQVDLYFLPLVNFRSVRLRDSAVAEYNALVSMYTSQTGNYGLQQTANLSIFGPHICTSFGDPYTPLTYDGGTPNPWYDELDGVYHFQIDIPAGYEGRATDLTGRYNNGTDTNDIVRVEIWDPDCYNTPLVAPPNSNQIVFTNTVTGLPQTLSPACPTTPAPSDYDRRQPCTPRIRSYDPQNPFWFVRIDENRGGGSPPGNGTCAEPTNYDARFNTVTEYTLYYYHRRGDGSVERRDLARYTKGGAESDSDTDMRWVSPGGSLPGDPAPDGWAGSSYGFAWDAGDGNFEIDLSTEVSDIYVSPVEGKRSFFLDVRGVSGASENGFDLWVGPRYQTVPSEINARNVDIVLHAGDYHASGGATIFGIGHLPMNSNATEVVTLTLTYVPPEWAGRTMRVSNFDNDSGAQPPVTFIFDTMPYGDWHHDGDLGGGNSWASNTFTVPSEPDYTFYGGFLQVVYKAGGHDTFGWAMTTDATPWLVE